MNLSKVQVVLGWILCVLSGKSEWVSLAVCVCGCGCISTFLVTGVFLGCSVAEQVLKMSIKWTIKPTIATKISFLKLLAVFLWNLSSILVYFQQYFTYLSMRAAECMLSVDKVLNLSRDWTNVSGGIAQKQETASWHMAWEPKKSFSQQEWNPLPRQDCEILFHNIIINSYSQARNDSYPWQNLT